MSNPLADFCVVLVRTQGPVNLGMIARLCGNLGIMDLRLVTPQCEINSAEVRMFATHSKDFILDAPIYADLASALHGCSHAIGTSARNRREEAGESLSLTDIPAFKLRRRASRIALVFGNEAHGLSDAEMIQCQGLLHLETFGPNYSYNLSQAVGITLYNLATAIMPPAIPEETSASRDRVEMLYQFWFASLDRFQYFKKTDRERFAMQLQRFFNRVDLTNYDVQLLWGMLAQFHYFAFGDRGPASAIAAEQDATDTLTKPTPQLSSKQTISSDEETTQTTKPHSSSKSLGSSS
jgi:tRNA/rRNA methyltransferase